MCSPAQAVTFAVAVVQRGAWPMDSFNSRAAWVQVVGRGGGGHGRLFRGHRARFAAPFCDCRARTVWGGGRGLTRTLARRIVSVHMCSLVLKSSL